MPFNRPDLQTLIDRVAADIESRLPGVDAKLRRQVLTVMGRSLAGAAHGLHGNLDWLSKQLLPDTAEDELLERHGAIWQVPRKQAAAAAGVVAFTGTSGVVIPAGTLVQRADTREYATDEEVVISGGTITAGITATAAGIDGNTSAASTMTLVNPIAGCNSSAVVDSNGLTGGTDIESNDALRGRILARIQAPPHGGRTEDYELWALEVAGVTRVWVSPLHLGVGTVGIYIVCDDQVGSIIPDAAKVLEVQQYIDARRPVTAEVTVFAPIAVDLDLSIAVIPNTSVVKAAVEAELIDLLRREAEPGATILISHIREAVSLAVGESDHAVVLPAADVAFAAGELAVLGTITWL